MGEKGSPAITLQPLHIVISFNREKTVYKDAVNHHPANINNDELGQNPKSALLIVVRHRFFNTPLLCPELLCKPLLVSIEEPNEKCVILRIGTSSIDRCLSDIDFCGAKNCFSGINRKHLVLFLSS